MTMNMTVLLPAGLVAKLLLKRYQLLCQPVLAVSCCLTLETSTMPKPRVFEAFQTKNSQLTLKIKHGICVTSAKASPKN